MQQEHGSAELELHDAVQVPEKDVDGVLIGRFVGEVEKCVLQLLFDLEVVELDMLKVFVGCCYRQEYGTLRCHRRGRLRTQISVPEV